MSRADIKESASVAHLWGQNLVAGESLTTSGMGGKAWSYDPRSLKTIADDEMAHGLNRFIIHESAHQPVDSLQPGIGLMVFGQWFNRHETWAEEARAWTDYLARSSYLLQQGQAVADVLIYYGEDTNVTAEYGLGLPDYVPAGYSYDFINPTGLRELLSVKGGRLCSPSGMSYKILCVDADQVWMSGEMKASIESLKRQGAVVCTPDQLASALEKTAPDAILPADIRFVHRHTDDAEIYWINKPSDDDRRVELSFRVKGLKPRVWHPETGLCEEVSYRQKGGRTLVTLNLVPNDAVFVVFSGKGSRRQVLYDRAETVVKQLDGPWSVSFQAGRGAPDTTVFDTLASWTTAQDFSIRHFSGTATYSQTFTAQSGVKTILDLGEVKNLAHIYLNGHDLGTRWKEPWTVDVTEALKDGENELVIEVTNLWPNRIIGDLQSDCPAQITYTHMQFFRPDSPLLPSGLFGPVKLIRYE